MGTKGGSGGRYGDTSYNKTKGLVPSNHSATVIGFDETGLPIIYDYGSIVPITKRTFENSPVTNITTPQEVSKQTYAYLKENNLLEDKYKDLKLSTKGTEYDDEEYTPFIKALESNKSKFANAFNIKGNEYDELAKRADLEEETVRDVMHILKSEFDKS